MAVAYTKVTPALRLYRGVLLFATPFILLRLWWRGRREPDYRRRIGERFGFVQLSDGRSTIWFHAVSAGEVIAAAPLIRSIADHYPQHQVLVSTMTPTGAEQVEALLGDVVSHRYAPYDINFAVARYWRNVRPKLLVLMETELWPNLIHQAATSDEESSMAGARYLVDSGRPKADYAIIGEPTGLQPIYAHKGVSMITVTVHGAAGHSSDPSLGNNALDTMHTVMGALMTFHQELAQQHQHPGFTVHVPTLNLGCMRAGDNPNRICGHAELQIDLRLLPGMDSTAVHRQLEHRCQEAAAGSHTQLTVDTTYPPVPPFESPADGDLTLTLAELSGRAPGTVAFGTEAHFLQTLGMQTVEWGPGGIDQAHQPNDYLEHAHIQPAIHALQRVISRYCQA